MTAVVAPPPNPVLAVVTRGGHVESFHRGVAVVVRDGRTLYAAGAADALQFWRSAAKPFQALTAIARLRRAGFFLSDRERALIAASHGGAPIHLAGVRELLRRGGVAEAELRCGVHAPYDGPAAKALVRAGEAPTALHHNCSGKHAGMLLAARSAGLSRDDYLEPTHPIQVENRARVAAFSGVDPAAVVVEVDGCGAPTFALSALSAARAYAAFASSGDEDAVALRDAVAAEPVAYAGEGRICTKLLQLLGARIYPKAGAEGFYALGLPQSGTGIAVKFDDGSHRATDALLAELLLRFAPEVDESGRAALRALTEVPVKNAAGRIVGAVRITLP
jgi:L-asparaginase II